MSEPQGHMGVGGRLQRGPADELIRAAFALEASDGPLLYHGMSLADLAHAVMLAEAGLIPPAATMPLMHALLELHAIRPEEFPFDPALGDAYTNREYALRQREPEFSGWLQAGRPRREVSTLGYLIAARGKLLGLTSSLLALMKVLLDLASLHRETLMPDYTYLQRAHPTTLGHYLLGFVQPITRDLTRLRVAFDHTNQSPAGAGSTNGSRLPLNRQRLAELLGFSAVSLHTRDAIWQADCAIEIMATATALLVNIDRLAEDLQIWATSEFDYLELADEHCRASVIMPHKKNPYSLAFVRGAAREMIGRLASTAALQATPTGQVDNRIFTYGGTLRGLSLTMQAVDLITGALDGVSFKTGIMAIQAADTFGGATDLAELLMLRFHLDAHTAHRIVGKAVRAALGRKSPLGAKDLNNAAQSLGHASLEFSEEELREALRPENIVATRTCPGGAAIERVEEMVRHFQRIAIENERWRDQTQSQIQGAEDQLLACASALSKPGAEAPQR